MARPPARCPVTAGWLLASLLGAGCAMGSSQLVVTAPVVDLRAKPSSAVPDTHDPLQETQLLYGEVVRALRRQGSWVYVEATEQTEFSHSGRWQGYPGWVPEAALAPADRLVLPLIVVVEPWVQAYEDAHLRRHSDRRFPMGTHLRATSFGDAVWRVELYDAAGFAWLPFRSARALHEARRLSPDVQRREIVRAAERFLGSAYYWGGRTASTRTEGQVTGVDCSALVNLAYRTVAVEIPRDAHEQFLKARPVEQPGPADLVFLSARDDPTRVVHVMLYAGNGHVIEGPGTGQQVRHITLAQRLGRPLEALPPGSVVDGQTVSYGAFLP